MEENTNHGYFNLKMLGCREMATLPAGYIPQRKVPSAGSSGSLGFIVCVQCCRIVYLRHIISIL